jgi:effector-binding domain-containing protein
VADVVLDERTRAGVPYRQVWGRPGYQIRLHPLAARPTAVVRATVRPGSVAHWLPKAHARVAAALAGAGPCVVGAPFARFTLDGGRLDVEAGFPVSEAITDLGEVIASGLPGGPAAVTLHRGPHELLDAAYAELDTWLGRRGLVEAGPHWEVYLTDARHTADSGRWRTRIVVPCRWDGPAAWR